MRFQNTAAIGIIICVTAAAAIVFRKAAAALFLGIYTFTGKAVFDVSTNGVLMHVTHQKLLLAHELVTRIDVTVRSDCNIFIAAAAAL